jgi:hypothetical protein
MAKPRVLKKKTKAQLKRAALAKRPARFSKPAFRLG